MKKIDDNYKPPAPFKPYMQAIKDESGEYKINKETGDYNRGPLVGVWILPEEEDIGFYVSDEKVPKLPIKINSRLEHMDWDIPTKFVIDAENQCWMDGAHGGFLRPVERERLLNEAETDWDKKLICEILEIEFIPEWKKKATEHGWYSPQEVDELLKILRRRLINY